MWVQKQKSAMLKALSVHMYTKLAAALKNPEQLYLAGKYFASKERETTKLVKASKEESSKELFGANCHFCQE